MKLGGSIFEVSVTAPSLSCVSTTGPAHTTGSILANSLGGADGAVSRGQRNALAYQNLRAKQFAERLNVPRSWILDYSNPESCDDPIPCLPLGKFKRFRWESSELVDWIERHIVCHYPVEPGAATADYEYLDSAQFAERLNISESWVRDGVRTRADEPIPHVRFGKYVRFRWGSPELEIWAERRMVTGNNRVVSRAQEKETIQ
jgi:predicted DNA-binding transcriptional regulator AlpA